MTATELLTTLRHLGVTLAPDGDQLRVDAPAGVLTDELRQAMRTHKAALLDLVGAVEERAAIGEGIAMPEERLVPVPHLFAAAHDGLPPCPQCSARQWLQGLTYYQCGPCGYRNGPTPGEILRQWCGTTGEVPALKVAP